MSSDASVGHPAGDATPTNLPVRLDPVCDRFEAVWLTGGRPLLEAFLPLVAEADRLALLRELLALELEYRARQGETPTAEEYRRRLPEHTALIEDVFTPTPTAHGSAPVPPTLPGYEVLAELGRGGMGVVYKVRQVGLNRIVALKMILAGAHAGQAERARFKAEAEAVARLRHPNIVQIYEVGESGGCPFFSLEFVDGGSLSQKLDGTPWQPRPAAELMETLARTVHAAHEQHVVHRDLKPANVLLAADGSPKVTDFGLAKRLDDAAGPTQSGAILGTPSYMAPEQAGGKTRAIGPAADVYALGAILYELLTGRPPFKAATMTETLLQVLSDEPAPPRRLQSKVPADLDTVCLKCLEKRPERRYASALELADELRRFLAGEPVRARPVGALERAGKWARRRPALAAAYGLLTAALVLGAGGGGATWLWLRAEKARGDAETARGRAETAENDAKKARDDAEKARDDVKAALQREQEAKRLLTQYTYADRISLAQKEWEAGRAPRAWRLLREAGDLQEQLTPGRRPWEWDYLNRLFHPERLVLEAHAGRVWSAVFSPDGARIATADDKAARLWDAESGRQLAVLNEEASGLVAFSPEGGCIATASKDGAVRLWDARSGKPRAELLGRISSRASLAFSPDGARVATTDGKAARLWDAVSGKQIAALEGHTDTIAAVSFSPDGGRLATASLDGTVRLWDVAAGRPLAVIKEEGSGIIFVAFSPDGVRLATVSRDETARETARVWDAESGRRHALLGENTKFSTPPVFSPDGGRIATADDKAARLWDAESGKPLAVLEGRTGPVYSLAFSPDGGRIAAACSDSHHTPQLWDATTGRQLAVLPGHTDQLQSVAFSSDGSCLVTASQDGTARIWDVAPGKPLAVLEGHSPGIDSVAFSPDGVRIATADHKAARLWDAASGRPLAVREVDEQKVNFVSFSPDGGRLATAFQDGPAWVWDADLGRPLTILGGGSGQVYAVIFSPDGGRFATAWRGGDGTAHVLDASGRQLAVLQGSTATLSAAAFSPDGGRIVTADLNGTARVWDAASGNRLAVLEGHTGSILSVAFSPDGGRLATASYDGTARVWDAASGKQLILIENDAVPLSSVAFSPDGDRLATASYDGTARVWDAASGRQLVVFEGDAAVAFSPDGGRLAAGLKDTVRVWSAWEGPRDRERRRRFWRELQAADAESAGRWFAAAFHLSRLIDARPADPYLYLRRSRTYALQADWILAAADLLQAALRQPAAEAAP